MNEPKRQFRQTMIAQAAALDGLSVGEIEEIIIANDVVAGVYPDPTKEDGFGVFLIKGRMRFEAAKSIVKLGVSPQMKAAPMKITAIPCRDVAQAIDARDIWGDGSEYDGPDEGEQ